MVEAVRLHPFLADMRHARQMPVEQQHVAKAPAGDARAERPVEPNDIDPFRGPFSTTARLLKPVPQAGGERPEAMP